MPRPFEEPLAQLQLKHLGCLRCFSLDTQPAPRGSGGKLDRQPKHVKTHAGLPALKRPARPGPGWIKAPRKARCGRRIGEGRATSQLQSDHAGLTREQIGIGRRTKTLGRRTEPPERVLSSLRSGMPPSSGWVWGWTIHLDCAPYVRFGSRLDEWSKPAGVPMRVAG